MRPGVSKHGSVEKIDGARSQTSITQPSVRVENDSKAEEEKYTGAYLRRRIVDDLV